jgi:type III secretion system YscC/HrcC family outer membrane pore protein
MISGNPAFTFARPTTRFLARPSRLGIGDAKGWRLPIPKILASLGIVLAILFAGIPEAVAQGGIPWNHSLTITRTSSDDDIKNVFRSILQTNGLSVMFGPSVHETVSFHLEGVPIDQAFEQLIDQHHLTYSYNPGTKTVLINATGGGGAADPKASVFVTLNSTTYPEVVQAVGNLGLGLGGLKYDAASRTLAISGNADRAKQIQTLVENLEAARKRGGSSGASLGVEEVKVIPLRFTDVGPSTRQFQGKTVTVPGIADTLRSVLGIDDRTAAVAGNDAPPPKTSPYGQPRISIDPRTNSVVVQGSHDAIAAVEKIITQLDRPLQMVQIEVLIVTANVGVAKQLGIDWRGSQVNLNGTPRSFAVDTGTTAGAATSGGVGSQAGGGQVTTGTNGQLFSSTGLDALSLLPAGAAGATTASFVIRGGQAVIEAQLQALESKDRARILSAPKLVTLDNITARITRSQNIFVQVNTVNPAGGYGGVGLQEIQTGLTLEITPSIVPAQSERDQSLVRLNLRAENSAPGTGSFGQIDVNSQEVQTNVLVPDSDTFVIGGLFDDSNISSDSGVPYLKDIPILGKLFSNTKNQKSLGETIFFITPKIVDERSVLQSDIAVAEGSNEYIRRARAELSAVGNSANVESRREMPAVKSLEEDE